MAHPNSEYTLSRLLLVIFLSFVVAISLSVYPLTINLTTLRPMILIMTLIFWLLFQPRYVGVFMAFIIGVIIDLLMDTQLGQHAFAAVMMTLAIHVSRSRLHVKALSIATAWLIAALALMVFQLTLWLLQLLMQGIYAEQASLSLITSIISWPLLVLLLRRFT